MNGGLWNFSTIPFSLPKQAPHIRAKNAVAQVENQSAMIGQGRRSEPDVYFLSVWYDTLEGLFYLIAWLFFKACPWHAFFI
jgi:hypothetical protein